MRLSGLALLAAAMAFCLAAFPFPERDAGQPVATVSTASLGDDGGAPVIVTPSDAFAVRVCGGTPDSKSGSRSTHAYLDSIDGNLTGLADFRAGGRGADPGIASA